MRTMMTKVAAGGGLALSGLLNDLSITLFNVPATVVAMAAAGAMLSFAYNIEGDEGMSRRRLYTLVLANTIFACAAVAVLPQWLGWAWNSPKIEGSLALLLAAIARFVIPVGLKLVPEVVRKLLQLGDKEDTRNTNDP